MSPDDTAPPSAVRRARRFALRYWVALILVVLHTDTFTRFHPIWGKPAGRRGGRFQR